MTRLPTLDALTRIVARSLGLSANALHAALAPAESRDLEQVCAFRRQNLHDAIRWDDAAYLRWRYRFGCGDSGYGDLWRLRRDGQILAILGTEELTCNVDGRQFQGSRVMDLLARADLRETGIGVWLNQVMLERADFTLAVGANESSAGIVARMFVPLAPRLAYTHPLDMRPFARRRWPDWPFIAHTLATAGNVGLAARRRWLGRVRPRDLRFVASTRFDDGFIATPVPGRAHALRDASYLRWRLLDNPRRRCQILVARRAEVPVGRVAWAERLDDRGRAELHVVDWQYDGAEVLVGLLLEVVRIALAKGCSCVRMVLQDSTARRVAASVGFRPARQDPGRLVGVQSRDADIAQSLAQAEWALTDADDDTDGF